MKQLGWKLAYELYEHVVYMVDRHDVETANLEELSNWDIICWDGCPDLLWHLSVDVPL